MSILPPGVDPDPVSAQRGPRGAAQRRGDEG